MSLSNAAQARSRAVHSCCFCGLPWPLEACPLFLRIRKGAAALALVWKPRVASNVPGSNGHEVKLPTVSFYATFFSCTFLKFILFFYGAGVSVCRCTYVISALRILRQEFEYIIRTYPKINKQKAKINEIGIQTKTYIWMPIDARCLRRKDSPSGYQRVNR